MSNKLISMEKVTLIKQLQAKGHSVRAISRKTGIHRKTVTEYLSGVRQQDETTAKDERLTVLTDCFPYFDRELSRVGVTRQLLWEEYRETHPDGYGYTQFCEHYSRHVQSLPREAVMHMEHVFGDCLQVDFAGLSKAFDKPANQYKTIIKSIVNNFV